MPNGTYGGVRGESKSPLLDFTALIKGDFKAHKPGLIKNPPLHKETHPKRWPGFCASRSFL